MWIDRLTSSSTTHALELSAQFAEQRQQLLAENIANIDTPNYVSRRLDLEGFQKALRGALDQAEQTRTRTLNLRDDAQFSTDKRGRLQAKPVEEPADNVLFHDGTNARLERLMSRVAENRLHYDLAATLLSGRYQGLLRAIRGRTG